MDFNRLLSVSGLSITTTKTTIGELQRDYLFKMTVDRAPPSVAHLINTGNVIDLYLAKGIFPNRKTSPIAVKWSGETYYHSGVDESPKTGDLTFRLDEEMKIKDFWEACKDLSGDVSTHAAVAKPMQTLDLGIYMVNVGKNKVTEYRKLIDVIVYSVENIELNKEGDAVSTFNVHISWDRVGMNNSLRGSTI